MGSSMELLNWSKVSASEIAEFTRKNENIKERNRVCLQVVAIGEQNEVLGCLALMEFQIFFSFLSFFFYTLSVSSGGVLEVLVENIITGKKMEY